MLKIYSTSLGENFDDTCLYVEYRTLLKTIYRKCHDNCGLIIKVQ